MVYRGSPRAIKYGTRNRVRSTGVMGTAGRAIKKAVITWHMLTERQLYGQVKEGLYRSNLKKMSQIASQRWQEGGAEESHPKTFS